jgi:hypothetical protein
MRRLWLALVLMVLTAAPAWAQEAPVPQPTPQAPPPTVVQPKVEVNLPGDESPECSWHKPSTWWDCITGSAKRQIESARERNIQKWIGAFTSFLKTPQPFNNDRVRELWLWMGGPIALALVTVLAAAAAGEGAIGNPNHMSKGELVGRVVVALAAGGASIIMIPWLIGLSNEAAQHMAFVPLDPSLLRHAGASGTGAGNVGFIDFIALLVFCVVFAVLLLLQLLRWVLVVFWCIFAQPATALYTHPDSADISWTYVKGLGALLLAPVADALLLSIMWWVVFTGHDIFPISWGSWLDSLLIVLTALFCLIVEAKALVIAFGIRNYSGLRRAMRRGRSQAQVSIQLNAIRQADTWQAGARERIGL